MRQFLLGAAAVFVIFSVRSPELAAQSQRTFQWPTWIQDCGPASAKTPPEVVAPVAAAAPAPVPTADKCPGYKSYIDQAKAEMGKKNDLQPNACQLYKSWAQLWKDSNCDAATYADAETVECPGGIIYSGAVDRVSAVDTVRVVRKSCDEIFSQWQTDTNWVSAGIQACDYSAFEVGCKPMAEAANDCETYKCTQNCTLKYACDPENFKRLLSVTPIYFNDPPRLQKCLDQLRRTGL